MRLVLLIPMLLVGAVPACINHVNVQCGQDSDCNLSGGGVCAEAAGTGNHWCAYPDSGCPTGYRYSTLDVGDGVSGVCVPMTSDAGIDANPINTYQSANLVLGQEDFNTKDVNHGGVSAQSLFGPASIAVDTTGTLWVHDSNNGRVLGWVTPPAASFAKADLVVGRTDFMSVGASTYSKSTFVAEFAGIGAGGGKLVIPNPGSHRVLIFNPSPTVNGHDATIVLGQSDFTSATTGAGASDLRFPVAAWTDGTRVVVVDSGNNRVLLWSAFPVANDQPATLVLGQPGFGTGAPGTTASSMSGPLGVTSDGIRLFVTDYNNNRVLIWNSFPTTNGQPADLVIGQSSFTSKSMGTSSTSLQEPFGLAVSSNTLFVADAGNNRILVYSPIPKASGASAQFVLGQPDFVTNTSGVSQTALHGPEYLAVQGNQLYVGDLNNNRVVRFGLSF